MNLAKRELPCEVCGETETAAIRDGAATGYVLCDDCNDRVAVSKSKIGNEATDPA